LVSGTKTMTKKIAMKATNPNHMNVYATPRTCLKDKNDRETMRLEIPPQIPLYHKGYISELITHGIV
jgi:hypothetical protein